jgi:predicted acetyltransferase
MAKMSIADKMRIQTLREQGFGAKAITAMYPAKNWSVQTVHSICQNNSKRNFKLQCCFNVQ